MRNTSRSRLPTCRPNRAAGYYLLQTTLNNRADSSAAVAASGTHPHDAGDTRSLRRVLPSTDWLPPSQPHEAFIARSAIELRILRRTGAGTDGIPDLCIHP